MARGGVLVVLFVFMGIFGGARVVRADPHAVFYTAIAQQQLFFNVLAALDQADYVETQFSREQLVEARATEETTPTFKDEEFPLTEATKVGQEVTSETDPGIADVLTRLITLEGTDQYTDQLVREFGAESGRRNSTSELLRSLCGYGLGIAGCDDDQTDKSPAEVAAAENYRRSAVVRDPLEWAALPFKEGALGALSSGTEADTAKRIQRLDAGLADPLSNVPRAYSTTIARWRREVAGDEKKSKLLDNLLIGAVSNYAGIGTQDNPYENIAFDADGSLCVNDPYANPKGSPCKNNPTAEELTELANDTARAPLQVREIAQRAAARVALQQRAIENEGLLSDVKLKPNPVFGYSQQGELSYLVKNPVAARKADVYSLPTTLALLDTSQRASSLAGLDEPGSVQLVDRASSSESSSGGVLGTLDLFGTLSSGTGTSFDYDAEKEATSPSGNIIAGHLEQGAVHTLRVMTGGQFRGVAGGSSCGFTCY